MPLWDKLKQELDRAGKAAQGAIDEGKTRLEAFRVRQQADKAAEALGYAVFRARQAGGDVDGETYSRLSVELGRLDAEAAKLEAESRGTESADTVPGSATASGAGSGSSHSAGGAATPHDTGPAAPSPGTGGFAGGPPPPTGA